MHPDDHVQLQQYVWNELVDAWQFGNRAIESAMVYQRLRHAEVAFPPGAMRAILNRLCAEDKIQLAPSQRDQEPDLQGVWWLSGSIPRPCNRPLEEQPLPSSFAVGCPAAPHR